jgi:ParB family transcriptional regulator, chromosome partitioning protein
VSAPDSAGKFRLIVGERRWQAARLAGLTTVPIMEREASPDGAMAVALVENLQRQYLDALEEAAAFDRLIRDHGLTQGEVAKQVGRSRPSITNSLRLLGLPSSVKDALIDCRISEGHARALLALSDSLAMDAGLQRIMEDGLTVRQTEALVASFKAGVTPRPVRTVTKPADIVSLEDNLRATLGTKVSIQRGRKAGRIVIEYYSEEDFQTLTERLLNAR